jgi:class 3 adenylate cyclase
MDRPETRYVTVDDAQVAYQVLGEGPLDLLYCYGIGSHVEQCWELPPVADFLSGLASFARLIIFDRRGTGASDALARGAQSTWEGWAEDIGAVLDAVGSRRAALMARSDAGPMAILYAATHPERVSGLVLYNTTARYPAADDYPIGYTDEAVAALIERMGSSWGTVADVARSNPAVAGDVHDLDMLARMQRSSVTPRAAAEQYTYLLHSIDVRSLLPLISAPTLVIAWQDNPILSVEHSRYMADRIEDAKLVQLPDIGIYPTSRTPQLLAEIAEFLTGERPAVVVDRVLTTVLFTDIVGSTAHAVRLGDHRWRELLAAHNRIVRDLLRQYRGVEMDTAGDGFFATFDGPARAIRCARAILQAVRELGLEVRAGLHTGEVELHDQKVTGLAVHIGARVSAAAGASEILVTRTVADLVAGSGIEFQERGERALKGVPGTWQLFAVSG